VRMLWRVSKVVTTRKVMRLFMRLFKSNQGCEGYQNNEGRAIQLSKVVMKGIRVNEALVQAPDPSL
jgi:hypothetical protein